MVFRRKQQLSVIKTDLSLGPQSRLFLVFLKSIVTLRDWSADPLLTKRLPCSDFFARGFYFFLGSRFPDIVGYNFRHHPRYFTTLSPINFAGSRYDDEISVQFFGTILFAHSIEGKYSLRD